MVKYKQVVIPEASTTDWATLTSKEVRLRLYNEYRSRYYGKKVVNLSLGITVEFEHSGAKKMSKGAAIYSKKACLVAVLDQLIKYAEYSNWGDRKSHDNQSVIGYLNFKAKMKIDEKMEGVHLVVRVQNNGKFHYDLEVNRKK